MTSVRFGGFEFDLSLRVLRKGGTRLRVPDQSLAILAMLLEHPGDVVTRETIQARLWPNGTVVEFEHSVNSAVKRLRQALLDTASTPRSIETLPRKGYRFIGTLEPDDPEELAADSSSRTMGLSPRPGAAPWGWSTRPKTPHSAGWWR